MWDIGIVRAADIEVDGTPESISMKQVAEDEARKKEAELELVFCERKYLLLRSRREEAEEAQGLPISDFNDEVFITPGVAEALRDNAPLTGDFLHKEEPFPETARTAALSVASKSSRPLHVSEVASPKRSSQRDASPRSRRSGQPSISGGDVTPKASAGTAASSRRSGLSPIGTGAAYFAAQKGEGQNVAASRKSQAAVFKSTSSSSIASPYARKVSDRGRRR